VQIGTATFIDPTASMAMADGLKDWAVRQGASMLSDLVGTVEAP